MAELDNPNPSKGCALCNAPFMMRVVDRLAHIQAFRGKHDRFLYCTQEHADFGVAQAMEWCERNARTVN